MLTATPLRATARRALIGSLAMWIGAAPFLMLSANEGHESQPGDSIASAPPASVSPSPSDAPTDISPSAAAAPIDGMGWLDGAEQALFEVPLSEVPFPIDGGTDEAIVVQTGAIVPSTPIAPGQGPLFDDLGSEWDEQRRSPADRFWYARSISTAWLPKNGSNGFGTTDVPIATSFAPVWFDDLPALLITPGFGFHFWQAPDALELPSTVFDAYVDIAWRTPVTERFGFGFGLTPGVYGDYRQSSPKAFQLTGWGLVDYKLTNTWTVVAGAAVVRQLDMRVLPVGGLIWTPNADSRLELLVPRSRYVRKVRSFDGGGGAWVYSAFQYGGGSWAVTLPDDTTALVTISDLRAILGLEWFRNRSMAGVAEVGYVFARTISANRVPEFNPSDTIMLSAGATF